MAMESSRGAPISGCTFDAMYIFDFVGQGAGGLEVLAHAIQYGCGPPRVCLVLSHCVCECVLFCGVLVPLNLISWHPNGIQSSVRIPARRRRPAFGFAFFGFLALRLLCSPAR